jgi:hypothetical protein
MQIQDGTLNQSVVHIPSTSLFTIQLFDTIKSELLTALLNKRQIIKYSALQHAHISALANRIAFSIAFKYKHLVLRI